MRRFVNVLLIALCVSYIPGASLAAQSPATTAVKGGQMPAAGPDWQQKWKTILAAAQKEGSLSLYGEAPPTLRQSLVATFEAKYGIKMEFVVGRSSELSARWERENTAGLKPVDIFHMGGITSTLVMKPKGAFGAIEPHLILPEVLDPKVWQDGRILYMDKDKMILPLNRTWTSYVAVNTDMVKEGKLKSYKDILKPEWQGKVFLFDPSIPGAAPGWVWLMTANFGQDEGRDYLKKFAATNPPVTKDVRQHLEWVAKGKYAIGVGIQSALLGEFMKMGAPINMNHFIEAGHQMPGSGIVEMAAKPAHPNAAIVYLNWLLTTEGQLAFNKPTGSPPVRLNVPLEGFGPVHVAGPNDKTIFTDESFYRAQDEVLKTAKDIFGHLLK